MKLKNIFYSLGLALLATFSMSSCSDEPLESNYYTFTGEMVSDYLTARQETYSEFIQILQRSGMYGMMATYGSYTCFAPTNTAIDSYLQGRNLSSVDQLTKEECDTIAWNHIINQALFTTDLTDGKINTPNMNDRFLTFSCDSTANGAMYYINMASKMIVRDDSVENGVVHTLDKVIQPSNLYLADMLQNDQCISLFYKALILTGHDKSIVDYQSKYADYTIGTDSVYKGVMFHRTGADYLCKYPAQRVQRYTVFAETDEVFKNNGIETIDQLYARAKQIYDAVYPEDKGVYKDDDYQDPKNPLNRFVAYHILPYYGAINDFTISESGIDYKTTCSMPNLIDATDWYTTIMPGTIMKMSSPSEGLYINRKGVGSRYTVQGVKVYTPTEMTSIYNDFIEKQHAAGIENDYALNQQALNGIYHYIDNILAYDSVAVNVVFNDRIRWNVVTLSPEFLNAGARGTTDYVTGFKAVEGWDFHGHEPRLALRERGVWMATYSDAVDLIGQFDISIKLPPLPANTYEVRFAYGAGNDRGVVQIYFGEKDNMKPMGLPIDFRIWGGDPSIGWVEDVDDEEENRAVDKAMHNRGYMKDMDSWNQGGSNNLRANSGKYRKILTTQSMSPDKEYWLRIKLVIDNANAELPINYFEFCPKSVYAGKNAEDTH